MIGPKVEQLIPLEFTFRLLAGIILKIKTKMGVISTILRRAESKYKFKAPLMRESISPYKFKANLLTKVKETFKMRSPLLKYYTISVNKPKNQMYENRKKLEESQKKNLKNALGKLLKGVLEDDE